jgi:hypothetical protein
LPRFLTFSFEKPKILFRTMQYGTGRPQFSRILLRYDESSAETPTTPTNDSCLTGNGEPDPGIPHLPEPGGTPHIPEPDYDVSDSCSGSESGWRDTATLRKEKFSVVQFKKRVPMEKGPFWEFFVYPFF